MAKEVTLTIDGKNVTVPAGTLVVDAAKKIDINIPVFCYHPKMEPVGMCRMCLVDVGRPMMDRATNQPILEADGRPKIQYGPKLETGCTTPVAEGMVVVTDSKKVADARSQVVEFILTSHPLDCPVCDKGGECPLQNLTLSYGPGQSRFQFAEKMHMAKHVPLGDLIYLDRERCIQCGRCVRFQSDIAGDPVIGFYHRGRSLEISTSSEPGFDSYFSGNTTDICPVGALTTADFRFGARAWELKPAASICTHCPVGCNLTLNVRREAAAGGKLAIKRAMPRQNESVNETWICDKGRFGYHYTESSQRLTQPLVRKGDELVPATWDEAIAKAAAGLEAAGKSLVALAGGRLSNEDLYALGKLTRARGGKTILNSQMAGGNLVGDVGMAVGSNLGALGKGAAILVIASDLHEEAPVWYLRVKAAAKRGAKLVVANARATKLDRYATSVVRYNYGEEADVLKPYLDGSDKSFNEANSTVVFFGNEGLDLSASETLAKACADLVATSGHAAQVNSGLVGVWPAVNTQGAWDQGFRPAANLASVLSGAGLVWVAAADPAGDDRALATALDAAKFVIVQELFLTETARKADVVFPVQSSMEREGTFTSGERRVQRFYQAVYPPADTRADYAVVAQVAAKLGAAQEGRAASLVFARLSEETSGYAGVTYQALAETAEQWPLVGRSDLYYGGTGYDNTLGLGVQVPPSAASNGWQARLGWAMLPPVVLARPAGSLLLVPVARLYDAGVTLQATKQLDSHRAAAQLSMNAQTAADLGLSAGSNAAFELHGAAYSLPVVLDESVPAGAALLPRSSGVALQVPAVVKLH
jgi:NADH-quinone oxidoreductase subunit G